MIGRGPERLGYVSGWFTGHFGIIWHFWFWCIAPVGGRCIGVKLHLGKFCAHLRRRRIYAVVAPADMWHCLCKVVPQMRPSLLQRIDGQAVGCSQKWVNAHKSDVADALFLAQMRNIFPGTLYRVWLIFRHFSIFGAWEEAILEEIFTTAMKVSNFYLDLIVYIDSP